jgi:Carboxypeptidase regulatory-like domain
MKNPYPLYIAVLLICLLPAVLFAQNETAVLAGRTIDPSGLPVPDAGVRLTRQSTGSIREGLTDSSRNYRFDLLEPGEYSLRVTAAGFKTYDAPSIHLQVAMASQLDISLSIGAVEDEVSVQADV